jgi:adenosine deaminase
LGSVLNKFMTSQKVLSSTEILSRLTRECIEDCAREGTKIVELRYSPTFIQQGHEDMSWDQIHAAIVRGIEQAKPLGLAVGLLITVQRTLPVATAERVIDFAIANKGAIVGVDLADNEIGFEPTPFASVFQRARKAGLGVTIHAGESIYPGMVLAVLDSIEKLGATRIGHGLQIHTDEKAMRLVADRGIVLELCPTSNWLTNAVTSVKTHPFVNEYEVLARDHRMTVTEFDKCNDTAARASFIPLIEKQKSWLHKINS